ncbi:unnamed protein product [Urochloa decumbens]|uniref:DUF6598 domain-containing protein n=1 Tax=Urochloa decumbens TaxID=240449 RepID=A0ABC8YFC3_9POAL
MVEGGGHGSEDWGARRRDYPKRWGCGYSNRFMLCGGGGSRASVGPSAPEEVEEVEETDLEPFFFDEAAALADYAAAEGERKRKEEEEREAAREKERRWKARMDALDAIRGYNYKLKCPTFTRFYFTDLSTFDLDEESPLGPMRYTHDAIEVDATYCCRQGEKRFLPCNSVNVLSVKVASLNADFAINVYGTVLARDSLDLKCVYLFRRDRNNCQLLKSQDDVLLLAGPKRGLALIDAVYVEMDLKIKDDQGQNDKQLSKGFLTLKSPPSSLWDKMTVELMFAVVNRAVEATISIEVIKGEFYGIITACTTSIQKSLVLHDSKLAGTMTYDGTGGVQLQLLRRIVAVSLKEKLEVTAADGSDTKSTIEFTPRASSGDENYITCGPIKMLVKVRWSLIEPQAFG